MKTRKKFRFKLVFLTSIAISIILFGAFGFYGKANGLLSLPFGGNIIAIDECSCSAAILLYVETPEGVVLPFMFRPKTSILYDAGQVRPGITVLGTYVPGPQCRTGRFCIPLPTTGLIESVGTSLY